MHANFDAISEDLNCKKKNDSNDMFGLKEPKERSGSSETAQKQLQCDILSSDDNIFVNH